MAVADYFLKIDGVEGESKDAKLPGAIQIESYSLAEMQTGSAHTGGGGGSGKVRMGNLNVVMKVNKASPKLFLACAGGKHLAKVVLICRKAGGSQAEFYKWTFTDVFVTAFQTNGSNHAEVIPVEQMSFAFGRVEVEYREQKSDGSMLAPVTVGWDVKANAPV